MKNASSDPRTAPLERTNENDILGQRRDFVPKGAGLIAIITGALALVGWALEVSFLKSVHPSFVAMNPVTAIAFVFCGIGLHLSAGESPSPNRSVFLIRFCGQVVMITGSLRLLGIVGLDLEIDRLLFASSLDANRMAPNTAAAFFLFGAALVATDAGRWRRLRISDVFALGSLSFGMIAVTGYAYGISSFYGMKGFIPMALNTGLTFTLISVALLFTRPQEGITDVFLRKDFGGRVARTLLPAVILAPICLGWIELEGVRNGWFIPEVGSALRSVLSTSILVFLIGWSASSLSRSHAVLARQKLILQSILNGIGDGVVVADPHGHVVLSNPAAERICAVSTLVANPTSWSDRYGLFLDDEKTILPTQDFPLLAVSQGREVNDAEFFVKNPLYSQGLFISVSGRPLIDDKSEIQGGVIVMRDISSRKRQEQTLRATNEVLEKKVAERMAQLRESENQVQQLQKMDAVGRLAGGMAHDFNNLLAAINMYSDLLMEEPDNSTVVIENSRLIKQVADRGAALTRQLLIFSRKQVIQYQHVDLNAAIRNFQKMLQRLITENVEIKTKLAADLWLVKADTSQIEQVILNLAINAKDAMPDGGTLTIETSNVDFSEDFMSTHLSVKKGPHVLVTISDNGSGMDPATQKQIFEPFFTTKPIGQGTGLGLTTVYGIVKQHQGTIWVYSELGNGTVFKIYFPATVGVDSSIETSPPKPVDSSPPVSRSETILLVEDEERLRLLFAGILEKSGYKVLVAENGEKALEICHFRTGPIDLLLTDVFMPNIGGFELAKRLEETHPNIRVVYMSGYTNESVHDRGDLLARGAFIQKPFDKNALLKKVREVCAGAAS